MRRDPEVVRVYVNSLLVAVKPTGQVQQYVDEARALRQIYLQEGRLRAFLEGPHVLEEHKHALVTKVFKARLMPMLYNLIRLLIDKKRILLLPQILEEFRLRGEEELGILVGRVTSATALDSGQQRRIQSELERLTGMRFILDYLVNPQLLGGVLIHYKDVRIDGTLLGRLQAMRSQLEHWLHVSALTPEEEQPEGETP